MGLCIELQDGGGAVLHSLVDPRNLLGGLLPSGDAGTHPMLASIDPYGDTVFNRLQMQRFLSEWAQLLPKAQTVEELTLLGEIEKLARRCDDGVHPYLKFIGD
jgi:hypothetical protein